MPNTTIIGKKQVLLLLLPDDDPISWRPFPIRTIANGFPIATVPGALVVLVVQVLLLVVVSMMWATRVRSNVERTLLLQQVKILKRRSGVRGNTVLYNLLAS